jgi:DNA polymerase-4
MPIIQARRLCPVGIYLPADVPLYQRISYRLHSILERFTPLVESVGLDEAFLDLKGATKMFGSPLDIANQISSCIMGELGIACSIGVARTKQLAKLASKAAKPRAMIKSGVIVVERGRGIVLIEEDKELQFLHPLDVSCLWGVGHVALKHLRRLGVHKVGDLAAIPPEILINLFGPSAGKYLFELAWALDDSPVEPFREAKSISHEETFPLDLFDSEQIKHMVVILADKVANRLKGANKAAKHLILKVRFSDFSQKSRSASFATPVISGFLIADKAKSMLSGLDINLGVRLLGLEVSGLVDFEQVVFQPTLFEDAASNATTRNDELFFKLADAIDKVRTRYGDDVLIRF